jgi:hypothetical protein
MFLFLSLFPAHAFAPPELEDASPRSCGAWYRDADRDGYGDATLSRMSCRRPLGWVANADDCDDTSAAAFPGGVEICDALDNDCDDVVDPYVCPGDTHEWEGEFYLFITTPTDWFTARETCQSYGYDLVEFDGTEGGSTPEEELQWTEAEIDLDYGGPDEWWACATDTFSEGTWTWCGGAAVASELWSAGEPNDAGLGEDYAQFMYMGSGMNDTRATESHPYVCKVAG